MLPPPIEAEKYLEGAGAFHTGSCCFWSKQTGGRGRKRGELVTKCHIPDVSDKVVPVYFRRRIQGLKARMMHGQENPFERVIVVTVQATALDGAVQADTATEIHDRFPRPE